MSNLTADNDDVECAKNLRLLYKICYSFVLPNTLFLILVLRPLYRLAKDRTALYILFSKCCANIASMPIMAIRELFLQQFLKIQFIRTAHAYILQILLFIVYLHVFGLALNRLFAIFLQFSYKKLWNKKNTQIFTLVLWLFGIFLGTAFVYTVPILSAPGIFSLTNVVQIFVGSTSACIYAAMLLKFAYNSRRSSLRSNSNAEKDRMLISMICLLSIIPTPLGRLLSHFQRAFYLKPDTICGAPFIGWVFLALNILNQSIMLSIEEICLLIFCKDFRRLVKRQLRMGDSSVRDMSTSNEEIIEENNET